MPSIDPDAGIPPMKWPIEAENLRTDALKFIYRTEDDEIDKFLQTEGKFFVCGLKGLGKTLALRAKKKTYIELARGDSELSYGYTLIPEEELDVLPSLQPSGGYLDLLEKIDLWKDIWGLAIGLSIISYFIDTKYDGRHLKRRIEDLFEF